MPREWKHARQILKSNALRTRNVRDSWFAPAIGSISVAVVGTQIQKEEEKKKPHLKIRNYFA